MTSLYKSRGRETEDRRINATGYIGPFHSKITVFSVLVHMSILVFYILLELIIKVSM
jgi:hypothetical protein